MSDSETFEKQIHRIYELLEGSGAEVTCATLAEGRRIERPWLITMPWFSGPVAGHSAVPSAVAESAGVEPASLLREPLFSRQVPYRPAHSPTKVVKELW